MKKPVPPNKKIVVKRSIRIIQGYESGVPLDVLLNSLAKVPKSAKNLYLKIDRDEVIDYDTAALLEVYSSLDLEYDESIDNRHFDKETEKYKKKLERFKKKNERQRS